ncbi:hypothetical protein ACNVED_08405 [Legionella sp. D16C41]|uniref:hypothetical protein n=1 Tax=Legionella sp. D16C41 TaxID=3402688 RepID=UPI003AF523F4
MPKVILHVKNHPPDFDYENASYQHENQAFGYFETLNQWHRDAQEDSLAWETLEENSLDSLSPEEIGRRLWTTYRELDKQWQDEHNRKGTICNAGTTASTTIYDGKGNLITATLADAASFAAVYSSDNQLLGVVRLNSVTHKPTDKTEELRINRAGGYVSFVNGVGRVCKQLAVSRAIGDNNLKNVGVCSESTIDITDINGLAQTK